MKLKQTINIDRYGRVSGLVHRGENDPRLDLRKLPCVSRSEKRVSDILFDSESSKYYVVFLQGPEQGNELKRDGKRALFNHYHEAIEAEVEFFNELHIKEGGLCLGLK